MQTETTNILDVTGSTLNSDVSREEYIVNLVSQGRPAPVPIFMSVRVLGGGCPLCQESRWEVAAARQDWTWWDAQEPLRRAVGTKMLLAGWQLPLWSL